MGRSGKKKKAASTATTTATAAATSATSTVPKHTRSNGHAEADPSFAKRTQALKDEGNRRFQSKDYAGAIEQYDLALKLLPKSHPDTAIFHSNRAACLMQMRPVDHHAVAAECSLALEIQPGFPRALLRRAKAMEALGKREIALSDINSLLAVDPNNSDAIEFAARLLPMAKQGETNECSSSNGSNNKPSSRPSPAALGASAVRGAPISGLGPCLPSRPSVPAMAKKPVSPPSGGKPERPPSVSSHDSSQTFQNGSDVKTTQLPLKAVSLKPIKQTAVGTPPPQPPSSESASASSSVSLKSQVSGVIQDNRKKVGLKKKDGVVDRVVQMRPLKLVYDHDIRLAKIPARCSFRVLREAVAKRFPSSKSVLIKYKDSDGDLVTITSTSELRLAESCVDEDAAENAVKMLRFHIVEVSFEQEPILPENDEEEEKEQAVVEVEDEIVEDDDLIVNSSNGELVAVTAETEEAVPVEKNSGREKQCGHKECKEAEIDDWLFEFAQLFRNHVGIDPDAHLDLHELGMELCSEALEETVTSDEAQSLFDMAASKFQEVAALAFFNWGNVHMCAARKRISLDDSASKEVMTAHLQNAYDWVQERYALAGQKYEQSLGIKPDFYEGLLALGQQHFENAKLQWSFAIANKVDLKSWDSSETIQLFNSAEEKMKAATEMWEKFEERRADELKDPKNIKIDELLKRRRKTASNVDSGGESSVDTIILQGELTPTEAAEQAAVMRSQIHLFWGNMLFERSQVEFKLGVGDWGKNLDAAVERFKLAGASESDINAVMKNHSSKEVVGAEFDEKKVTHLINVAKMSNKDEEDSMFYKAN